MYFLHMELPVYDFILFCRHDFFIINFFIKVYREMFISLQLIKMARRRGNVELYQATNFCDKAEQYVLTLISII